MKMEEAKVNRLGLLSPVILKLTISLTLIFLTSSSGTT
ncbi:hypothetical protein E2C01_087359 [Portunus trituberculatus]|uniref:Uncharacterized protein n=1 Tax=Portunus trituberculatus TaxID=210409 RepID=A0A5B7J6D9_PORTR|nr:hypothetical protein [Portunus trituberculatus]